MTIFQLHKLKIHENHAYPSFGPMYNGSLVFSTLEGAKNYLSDYLKKNSYTGELGFVIDGKLKYFTLEQSYKIVKLQLLDTPVKEELPF